MALLIRCTSSANGAKQSPRKLIPTHGTRLDDTLDGKIPQSDPWCIGHVAALNFQSEFCDEQIVSRPTTKCIVESPTPEIVIDVAGSQTNDALSIQLGGRLCLEVSSIIMDSMLSCVIDFISILLSYSMLVFVMARSILDWGRRCQLFRKLRLKLTCSSVTRYVGHFSRGG